MSKLRDRCGRGDSGRGGNRVRGRRPRSSLMRRSSRSRAAGPDKLVLVKSVRRLLLGTPLLVVTLAMVVAISALACGGSDSSDAPSPTTEPAERTVPTETGGSDSPGAAISPTAEPTTGAESDREALVALYNATDGPNWTNNTNWLSEAPLDQWQGILIARTGRVATVWLEANGLSGEIPPEVGNLSNLDTLTRIHRTALWGHWNGT